MTKDEASFAMPSVLLLSSTVTLLLASRIAFFRIKPTHNQAAELFGSLLLDSAAGAWGEFP
jgi:hypothetical protein